MKIIFMALAFVCLSANTSAIAGGLAQGRVVAIIDGDTIKVLVSGANLTLRIVNIDAPEKCQSYGVSASETMSELALNRSVQVDMKGKDAYGRSLAKITMDNNEDLGAAMIDRGSAWVYRKYSSDPILLQAEGNARRFKVGLWREENPQPPWDWRSSGAKCPTETAVAKKPRYEGRQAVANQTASKSKDLSPEEAAEILSPIAKRMEMEAQIANRRSGSYSSGPDNLPGSGQAGTGPIRTGPRGGQYYINSSGNPQYIKR